jgi:hypothetical protein
MQSQSRLSSDRLGRRRRVIDMTGPSLSPIVGSTSAEPPATPVAPRAALVLRPVESPRDLQTFIELPYRLYADDPVWIPPLYSEQKHQFTAKNPFFEHGRVKMWTAHRGETCVGRISAQVDELRIQRYDDATGHFGVLEADDDAEVFAALLAAAEEWLRGQNMRHVLGPFNLSINGDIGILIDGFEHPPVFLTSHGRRYYDARVQEQGYRKAKDVVAYRLDPNARPPAAMIESARRARESAHITIRSIDKSRLQQEVAVISEIFNDAWADNWSFVPFTEREFADLASALRWFVPPGLIQFAEVDGEAAAMLVVVPNMNELIHDLHGRLLPFGWAKLAYRFWRRPPRSARVALMGVKKKFQRRAMTMPIAFGLIDAARQPVLERKMRYLEMGWTLEDNFPMLRLKRVLGGRPYKTYRIYEKAL